MIKRLKRNELPGLGRTFISECDVTLLGTFNFSIHGSFLYYARVDFKRKPIKVCPGFAAPRSNWTGERRYKFRAWLACNAPHIHHFFADRRRGYYAISGNRAAMNVAGRTVTVQASVIRAWFGDSAPKEGAFAFRFYRAR